MVNWIELGLFLYAMTGSASIGYWALVSYSPTFRERDKNTKLGYSVITGLLYVAVVFFACIFLTSGRYNNLNFLETFFWLLPVGFVLLALTAIGKRAWLRIEQYQYDEQAGKEQAEEIIPRGAISKTVSAQARPLGLATKEAAPVPIISDETPELESPNEKETALEPEALEEEPKTETESVGEHERDVEEEIRKIMKGEMTEEEKKQEEIHRALEEESAEKEKVRKVMRNGLRPTPKTESVPTEETSKPQTGMDASEIEKIKEELKKKIKAGSASEKIKEELKKKNSGRPSRK